MKKAALRFFEVLVCVAVLQLGTWGIRTAWAHSMSPAFVTWSPGQVLTYNDLNNALAHLHNTFTAGITDAMISSSAAIAHSKMATPALLPKAWARISSCTGASAAGTACTILDSSQVTKVASHGTTGQYEVTLAYTPTDQQFVVTVNTWAAGNVFCYLDNAATTAPQFTIKCVNDAGAATDAAIGFVVFDT